MVAGHLRDELDLRVLQLADEPRVARSQLEHAVDGRRLRERLRIDDRQLLLDADRELACGVEHRSDVGRVWAAALGHSGGGSEPSLSAMPDQLRA